MNIPLDARDAVLYSACPLVMAPTLGTFVPLAEPGKRLVAAADGLYLEARSTALHWLLKVAAVPMPYGPVTPFLHLPAGPVPKALLDEIYQRALRASPREIAFTVLDAHGSYELVEPTMHSASSGHVTYTEVADAARLVLDVHSHGEHAAYFSSTDDASDLSRGGPYIAGVIAPRTERSQTRLAWRAVCPPYLIALDPHLMQGVFA